MRIYKSLKTILVKLSESCRIYTRFVCLYFLTAGVVQAGVYAGFEGDHEGGDISFLGIQGGGKVIYELFLADMDYEYQDSGALVKVKQETVTPTVGLSKWGTWNYSASAGPTFNHKKKDYGTTTVDETEIGGVVKFAVNSYQGGLSRELLGSYSTSDDFIWTRARLKRIIKDNVSLGSEIFWMGNQDAESYGVGILADMSGASGGVTIKIGYKTSTNDKQTIYGGVEGFMPF